MGIKINYIGQKFGRLTALEIHSRDNKGRKTYLCQCECGNIKPVSASHLKQGNIRSCGCYNAEKASQHCKKMNILRIKKPEELRSARAKNDAHRYYNNKEFKIKKLARGKISRGLLGHGNQEKYIDLIGCSFAEYRRYIESNFKDGMTWENKGQWEIDHITPLYKFNLIYKEQKLRAFNHKNTIPLWKYEHVSKTKIDKKCVTILEKNLYNCYEEYK